MAEKTSAVLRLKRQLTLPREICEQLGIDTGDLLELTVEDATLVVRPRRAVATRALREIQRAFKASGVTETELQAAGRLARQQIARERDGAR